MIALALVARVMHEPPLFVRVLVRHYLAPMMLGYWAGEFLWWVSPTLAVVIFGLLSLGGVLLAARIVYLLTRGPGR